VTFYTMSGSGNDFIVLDGRETTFARWTPDTIREACDRRMGIGADGLVILTPEPGDRVRMDFWNCDGSRADMCGNAALCSTRLAAGLAMAGPDRMQLVTRAGTFPTRLLAERDQAELWLPDVRLPAPVPGLGGRAGESGHTLSTVGVPHLALLVEELERPDLMDRGRELRFHPAVGPAGANVNFLAPAPDGIDWCLRTYERGVEGETLACGTGAVAGAISLVVQGRATMPVRLHTRSGRPLVISATLSGPLATDVRLRGEGRLVFQGEFSTD
jgi:diaminopimelate epimerase